MNENIRRTWLKNFFSMNANASAEIPGCDAAGTRYGDSFGVFIPTVRNFGVFRDKLNVMELILGEMTFHEQNTPGVFISCNKKSLGNAFIEQCVQILSSETRAKISQDPISWWQDFKALTGNVVSEQQPYFVFAEFLTYLYLVKRCAEEGKGIKVKWNSCGANHDIETSDGVQHEVKSTISHHESFIHSSNDFQLKSTDAAPLMLYFCRIDNSNPAAGVSINQLVQLAGQMGCDVEAIERILERQHLPSYSLKRQERFLPLQFLSFDVKDPLFPKFCHSDIPSRCHPECIEDVTYKINLTPLLPISSDLYASIQNVIA